MCVTSPPYRGDMDERPVVLANGDASHPAARLLDSSKKESGEGTLVTEFTGRHLVANFERIQIVVDGRTVDLTRRELRLLQCLLTHRNHVLTRDYMLAHVWDRHHAGSRTVDSHIARLRKKLGVAGEQIQTLFSVGYRFNEP